MGWARNHLGGPAVVVVELSCIGAVAEAGCRPVAVEEEVADAAEVVDPGAVVVVADPAEAVAAADPDAVAVVVGPEAVAEVDPGVVAAAAADPDAVAGVVDHDAVVEVTGEATEAGAVVAAAGLVAAAGAALATDVENSVATAMGQIHEHFLPVLAAVAAEPALDCPLWPSEMPAQLSCPSSCPRLV